MKRFLAILMCISLCTQPVLAVDPNEVIRYGPAVHFEGLARYERLTKMDELIRYEENVEGEKNAEESGSTNEGNTVEKNSTDEKTAEDTGTTQNTGVEVSAPSALLMESSTGQVIYEKDADSKRPPASVTKIMTLLLIFDALKDGKIKLEDEVTTSEYAASMGGSQVFLEPGEVQTVDTLVKCISVASANDACVAFNNR